LVDRFAKLVSERSDLGQIVVICEKRVLRETLLNSKVIEKSVLVSEGLRSRRLTVCPPL
jgi:hypothetical protein